VAFWNWLQVNGFRLSPLDGPLMTHAIRLAAIAKSATYKTGALNEK